MKPIVCALAITAGLAVSSATGGEVRLITLDPAHFHAALVQKSTLPGVSPIVHVYAPAGPELQAHLDLIHGYNTRADNPTHWQEQVYTGADFLDRMISEHAGNVVVISGNNAKKTQYIARAVEAGFNVLSDKPMAITDADFSVLTDAFARAAQRKVLLCDIMTERHEITTTLQRALSRQPALFGTQETGTPDDPAMTEASVHYFYKLVSGKPLTRPPWFYDTSQQGEGIVDVATHLVDLVQWECFPDQTLAIADVRLLKARHWTTPVTPAQFKKSTGLDNWPDYLKKNVGSDGNLGIYANGEMTYTLRGVHAKVTVTWDFQPPPGGGDTHYSVMRGTQAALIIRQGQEQNFEPTLYVENRGARPAPACAAALQNALANLAPAWPGLAAEPVGEGVWKIVIPAKYRVGHEAHFAQVTKDYLHSLAQGHLPAWEVPNMIVKYYTTTRAWQMCR